MPGAEVRSRQHYQHGKIGARERACNGVRGAKPLGVIMIWTRDEARAVTDRALSVSKGEVTVVSLNGGERANVRFARNTATTSGASSGYNLAITASFGKRS